MQISDNDFTSSSFKSVQRKEIPHNILVDSVASPSLPHQLFIHFTLPINQECGLFSPLIKLLVELGERLSCEGLFLSTDESVGSAYSEE